MERRYLSNTVQLRADGEEKKRAIGGIAAMVNTPTVLWESKRGDGRSVKLIEEIKPGAFDGVMGDDVRALFNHNDEKVLGRTSSNTLRLHITGEGHLGYDIPDVPETTYGNDLLISVERGDVTQSSFGFSIDQMTSSRVETDTEIVYTDTITRMKRLYDVSPVTFPAYEQTVTELRSKRIEEIERETVEQPDTAAVEVQQQQLDMTIRIAKHK
jgi:HK97 family phage prohead protease